jgi:uncharacterized protein YbdZ (MbtH family)
MPQPKWQFALLLVAGSFPAWSYFGDTEQITAFSPIPRGWVITSHTGFGHLGDYGGVNVHITITDMNGAPYGTTRTVLGNSPVPDGWAVIETHASGSQTYKTIKCLLSSAGSNGGAVQFGDHLGEWSPSRRFLITRGSPVPPGWEAVPEAQDLQRGEAWLEGWIPDDDFTDYQAIRPTGL